MTAAAIKRISAVALLVVAWQMPVAADVSALETPAVIPSMTPHPPIEITENEGPNGFTLGHDPQTGEPIYRPGSGVTFGRGTPDDPYVIEGWLIGQGEAWPTPGCCHFSIAPLGEAPIHITNTDAHVLIRGNSLHGMFAPGVHLGCMPGDGENLVVPCEGGGVRNVTVESNRISSAGIAGSPGHAVGVLNSREVSIVNNELRGNIGVDLANSHDSLVHGNTVDGNWDIYAQSSKGFSIAAASSGNTITRNTVENVRYGAYFSEASWQTTAGGPIHGNAVTENEFSTASFGFYLRGDLLTTWGDNVVHYNNLDVGSVSAVTVTPGAPADLNADLRFNWWGCPEGVDPDNPDCPNRWGSSRVRVDPWLTEPYVPGQIRPAAGYKRPGGTELVSVGSDGAEGDDSSWEPAVSADGRHVAFYSEASTLVPGDTNGVSDVFVHDRETGVTERVSVASDGAQGDGPSFRVSISADGRHVAFFSEASNLVPDDTNETGDVFVHDRQTGVTERVSVASDGTEGTLQSAQPSISADGRYVAFTSQASNLVPEKTSTFADVFVHDRQTGVTERASVASDGTEGNHVYSGIQPVISADGRYVAFHSLASNLGPGITNGAFDVFVHDRQTGATERVSVAGDGTEANEYSGGLLRSSVSDDGRYVAFQSLASNLVPGDTNETLDVFVRDRVAGVTERVSVASDGAEGNDTSRQPAISPDGRFVAFHSFASNLDPPDANPLPDVFVHDRKTGATERVSVSSDGVEGDDTSWRPALSADGRWIAFQSVASNLVGGVTNEVYDVYVRDRGHPTGIGGLAAVPEGGQLSVSGWATFSGEVVASAEDPADDGALGADELGAEVTGASLTYRPERGDVLFRLDLASLPEPLEVAVPDVGTLTVGRSRNRVLYGWSFTAGGTVHEIRAMRPAATAEPPAEVDPYFALFACDDVCTEVARLSGGVGTTGLQVRTAVPLEAIGVDEGSALTGLKAWTALGEAATGALLTLDEVELPDASLPVARVDLAIAPASTPEGPVYYTNPAALTQGRFSGTVDASSLPAGEHRVWARACLGEVCAARSLEVPK